MAKQVRHFEPKVQRPVDYDEGKVQEAIAQDGSVLVTYKYDGIRCLVHRSADGKLTGYTRNGIEIQALREFFRDALQEYKYLHALLPDTVLDCEVLLKGCTFEQSSGAMRRKQDHVGDATVQLHPFDIISMQQLLGTVPSACLHDRLGKLRSLTGKQEWVEVQDVAEIRDMFNTALAEGYEGLVVKRSTQNYTGGKVQGWWKLKPDVVVGGVVEGILWGTQGKANQDLPVGFQVLLDDGTTCNATGIPDDLKHLIKKAPHKYMTRALDVKAMERTHLGNLRHPKFYRWRDHFEHGTES